MVNERPYWTIQANWVESCDGVEVAFASKAMVLEGDEGYARGVAEEVYANHRRDSRKSLEVTAAFGLISDEGDRRLIFGRGFSIPSSSGSAEPVGVARVHEVQTKLLDEIN